ncbi:MAG TPA: CBO0543 family protein, partial [Symbiobacteriaceae bacterium]|nr:CBO0543 family protein [Symbiobacteriaceae bacterium]
RILRDVDVRVDRFNWHNGRSMARYHIEVVPTIPAFVPWDYAMYPVGTMLFIQFFPTLSPAIKALAFAATASFLVEPIFTVLDLYIPLRWNVFYSFPIHGGLFLVAYAIYRYLDYSPLSPGAS